MTYKIGMVSLGCPKNLCDTENMLGILAEQGHRIVSDPREAEVIIINTCSFIGDAKTESIDKILEMARYKDDNCKCLIAAGCLAQRYSKEIPDQLPEVDAIVGTGDYPRIAEIVTEAMAGGQVVSCEDKDAPVSEGLARILTTPSYTAYLKISEGCDNRCTYCIIPTLRGRYRSRRMEEIVAEARALADSGVKELILIAQDTTRYGIDLYGEYKLAALIKELSKIEKVEWIRLHYMYPEAITDELIETMAANQKVCKYFDIPLQHASDEVLRRMNRRNTKAQAEELIGRIRNKIPGAAIRTTFIAGFPGESLEQFYELKDFIEEMKFDRLGVFAYSPEEDTAAYSFADQIEDGERERRRDELMELASGIIQKKHRKKVGSVITVLCEGYDSESYLYFGRSEADSIGIDTTAYFAAQRDVEPGEFVRVKVLCAQDFDLVGEEEI